MIKELIQIENKILKNLNLTLSAITADWECREYYGYNFLIENKNIKFRKAKVTPKKSGQFVTLWKRNTDGKTEPFGEKDNLDFVIIVVENGRTSGFFLFPKTILAEKGILTSNHKEGKRGFRVYSTWDKTNSNQAERTKCWQIQYFFDLENTISPEYLKKFQFIFTSC